MTFSVEKTSKQEAKLQLTDINGLLDNPGRIN